MEANLNDVEVLMRKVLNEVDPPEGIWSSAQLCRALGRELSEMDRGPGILRSAFEQNVPVFIPAFTDSEIGLDMAVWAMSLTGAIGPGSEVSTDTLFGCAPAFNPFLDLRQYASMVGQAPCLGIFTVGGGVPRNWAQQVGPFYDVIAYRLGVQLPTPRFQYGVRICPEPVHWGGLSGCTYAEGVSWGKFVPPAQGGRFAEVYADATLVWPLLVKGLLETLDDS
jgi:deoxyhypusine synthase